MLSRLRTVVALAVAVTAMLVPVAAHAQGYYPGAKLGTDTSSHSAHLALRPDGTRPGRGSRATRLAAAHPWISTRLRSSAAR